MAADQRKRRLNGTIVAGCSSREQYRAKKKSLGLPQYDLNMNPHISLEWDNSQKRVVPKREQICLTRRDTNPIIDSVPHCQNIVADVFTIPPEMFELENLKDILSYEVWQTLLSENGRNLLTQFLPNGEDVQNVVQALLAGENFHFGNPFLKWGASLCSGNLHPDTVFHREQCFKANKKSYYSELQKYHHDMIGSLQKMKERWASCKDPEKEFVQSIWRSRKLSEKNILAPESDSKFCDPMENLGATSESCSWVADDKACSSDNQNSSMMMGGELQKRNGVSTCRKGFMMDKSRKPLSGSDDTLKVVARSRKAERVNKRNVHCSDGAKYMSYFKISKKQHQLVMSMKQSGKSIQSKSLNRVLGDLDGFHVQPYEVYEEEERKKLHNHWLQVATRDLPAAFANWRNRQSQRLEITKSLERELEENLKYLMEGDEEEEAEEDEEENSDSVLHEQDSEGTDQDSTMEDEELDPASFYSHHLEKIQSLNSSPEVNPIDIDSEDNHIISNPVETCPDVSEYSRICSREVKPIDIDSEDKRVISKPVVIPPDISEYSRILNPTNVSVSQGVRSSSAIDVWSSVNAPESFYHSTLNPNYASSSELSLGHPPVIEEHQTRLIDLECDLHEENHEEPNNVPFTYQNNEPLQSFVKTARIPSYHYEQKQTGLDFQPIANLIESRPFLTPMPFREQLQPPLQQNIPENLYSDGGTSRYFIPRPEHLSPPINNTQDWAVNSLPLQPHSNSGEFLNQNWFSGNLQVRNGWSGSEGACVQTQNIGSLNNLSNGDGHLFNVLSGATSYNSLGSSEQFIPTRNFGVMNGGIPCNNNVLPQTSLSHSLDYLNGRETAAASLMANNIGWMGLPHQNSALHDLMGKQYLRSWNQ